MEYQKEERFIPNASFWRDKNCIGWIIKDEATGKYDYHNANDLGNFDLDEDVPMNVYAKVIRMEEWDEWFGGPGYILEFSSKDVGLECQPEDLMTFEEAIEKNHECWSGLEKQVMDQKRKQKAESSKSRSSKK